MTIRIPLVQTADRLINQLQLNIKQVVEPALNAVFNGRPQPGQTFGTPLADNAAAGNVGEYKTDYTALTNIATSGAWFDAASILLTAGDWDLYGAITYRRNGATVTALDFGAGISGTTGNSATGLGVGTVLEPNPTDTTTTEWVLASPLVRVQSDGSNLYIVKADQTITTLGQSVYLKGMFATISSGTVQYNAYLRARRAR